MLLLMIQKQTLGLTAPKSSTSECTEKALTISPELFNLDIGSWHCQLVAGDRWQVRSDSSAIVISWTR